jgi:hypothetical protein
LSYSEVIDVSRAGLTKLFLLIGYASGSAVCLGSALIVVCFLYNEEGLVKSIVCLPYTLAATAVGLYLYFRVLKLLSPKRRISRYPAADHSKH